jgi:hypothetical protein
LVDGLYVEIGQSVALPLVTADVLQTCLDQAQVLGETSWAKSLRRWGNHNREDESAQGYRSYIAILTDS